MIFNPLLYLKSLLLTTIRKAKNVLICSNMFEIMEHWRKEK